MALMKWKFTTTMGSTSGTAAATYPTYSPGAFRSTIDKLLEQCRDADEEFNKRAILSLLRKLKDKPDELDSLVSVITNDGNHESVTNCITIPRTSNGRLQVAGRKRFPHVMYARMWRWPDVCKNELKRVQACQFSYDLSKLDCVCVNPYHYERIKPYRDELQSLLSAVNVSHGGSGKQQQDQDGESREPLTSALPAGSVELSDRASPERSRTNSVTNWIEPITSESESEEDATSSVPDAPIQRPVPVYDHSAHVQSSQAALFPYVQTAHTILPPSPQMLFPPNYAMTLGGPPLSIAYLHMQNQLDLAQIMRPPLLHFQPPPHQTWKHLPPQQTWENPTQNPPPQQTGENPQPQQKWTKASAQQTWKEPPTRQTWEEDPPLQQTWKNYIPQHTRKDLPPQQKRKDLPPQQKRKDPPTQQERHDPPIQQKRKDPPSKQARNDMLFRNAVNAQPLAEFWCTIAYFESGRQVGEPFKVRSADNTVYVDGYDDLGNRNRFCLGSLTNVFRLSIVNEVRRHIGRGIMVESKSDGSVWLSCLSDCSIFVKSYVLDQLSPGDTVHKVHPLAPHVKVFDLRQCYFRMLRQVWLSRKALGGVDVDKLRCFCMIRLSFSHPWGPDVHFKTIEKTPCWIEIHLHRALQLLHQVLKNVPKSEIRGV